MQQPRSINKAGERTSSTFRCIHIIQIAHSMCMHVTYVSCLRSSVHCSNLDPMDPLAQALADAAPSSDESSAHYVDAPALRRRAWRKKRSANKSRSKDAALDALHLISETSAPIDKIVVLFVRTHLSGGPALLFKSLKAKTDIKNV